ncbi:MAG: hypothetical protein RI973_432 [Bacteroidota bacterium]|jgi:uncharacterized protein (TIGR02145 family)
MGRSALAFILLFGALLLPSRLFSQTDPSALFEVQSTDKGFLLPRMTQEQREAIVNPAKGLMIFNTTAGSIELNQGSSSAPDWVSFIPEGKVEMLDCAGATASAQLVAGQQAANVAVSIPYTGGDGGFHGGEAVSSTGVAGLAAIITGGNFEKGNGSLTYFITGMPVSAGTASFFLSAGGQHCTLELTVTASTISALACNDAVITGTLMPGQVASGVTASVPYAGGAGGPYTGQMVTSTGVTGLTATLAAGSFANGNGSLTYAITGTATVAGLASFALDIGGKNCTLLVPVGCGAYVAPGQWKVFMCHNLAAANTAANPFQPGWEVIGGYWQWGRKGPEPSAWLTTNTENFAHGPTGPGAAENNEAAISGWNSSEAPNGAWSEAMKTGNDPCPEGFRLPAKAQWEGVLSNNATSIVGSWSPGTTNYSSGRYYGPALFLPSTGYRLYSDGLLNERGAFGVYWSSKEDDPSTAWCFYFESSSSFISSVLRIFGLSARCIVDESPPPIGALNCESATTSGTLIPGQAAAGVSASVPYTAGTGSPFNGQAVTSTGVTGLTATLAPGSFANGNGSLTYAISGTVNAPGLANFELNIAGQSCTMEVPICGAFVAPGQWKAFLCHNLAAANTSANPFQPSWEINGGYWQWGRKGPDPTAWLNTNTQNFAHGPSGPGANQTNQAAVGGWGLSAAPNGAWSDASKTVDDPCPAGFRVPTKTQWSGLIANNSPTLAGTWNGIPTNYSSGRLIGSGLMLPASGNRKDIDGSLFDRGGAGYYWSSTEEGTVQAWDLSFSGGGSITMGYFSRNSGYAVRCIAEDPPPPGSVSALNCGGTVLTGRIMPDEAASGVSASVPYTGGNGGPHNGQTAISSGVTGLTATLTAGNFANGNGSLTYSITGTAAAAGLANFALDIGGKTCTLQVPVGCGAYVAPGLWKVFMCQNLAAANTSANPFQPSWEIAGGYWQWGRKGPDPSTWLTTNTEHFAHGPTGSGAGQANAAAISGWSQTNAPNGAWSDAAKTADDPCPTGYRMPTKAQWDGVLANNNPNNLGSWFSSSTNFSSGCLYGTSLFLPASGSRNASNGQLSDRGNYGYYWSSTEFGAANAWLLNFDSDNFFTSTYSPSRGIGNTVRCIFEAAPSSLGSIGALNCGSATTTGPLLFNQAATGVSTSVPYTGGNGGSHNGQTVNSTGVTGLTASLAPGSFSNGSGSLTYTITGIPAADGQASFALSIGGQTCNLLVRVGCGAYVAPGQWKAFMCHNLAAANTAANPLVPSWEINGGYWQWGRKGPSSSQWLNTNTPNFAHGPTGSGSGQTNEASISGWSSTLAPNGAWSDASKTANDPCPAGFRVPTSEQLVGVLFHNFKIITGTWSASATNYSSGFFFGSNLMLPAAGIRSNDDGQLYSRGSIGYYWSSTEHFANDALMVYFASDYMYPGNHYRRRGQSLRCIAE